MASLILSYPGASFRPDGAAGEGAAAGSVERRRALYAAMGQWLELCDHLTRAGGHILVIDPRRAAPRGATEPVKEPAAAAVYAGRLGALFLTPGTLNTPIFLRSRGDADPAATSAAARPDVRPEPPEPPDPVGRAIAGAGLQVLRGRHRFQGQLDVISIERNRYILTYGHTPGSSSRPGLDEVKELLPLGAQTLVVELQPPFTAGAQGIAYLTAPSGAKVLLVHRGALRSHTPEDLAHFAGNKVEYFVLSAEDAEARVAECVVIRGTVIMGPGSSTILRGQLARRGFQIIETDVSQLFAPGEGGPRALVCELPGIVLDEDAPSYATRRDELFDRRTSYKPAP